MFMAEAEKVMKVAKGTSTAVEEQKRKLKESIGGLVRDRKK